MKCGECQNEQGVTVLHTIKIRNEVLEIRYGGGICKMSDGRTLCWWCALPSVGQHLL